MPNRIVILDPVTGIKHVLILPPQQERDPHELVVQLPTSLLGDTSILDLDVARVALENGRCDWEHTVSYHRVSALLMKIINYTAHEKS